MLGLPPYSPLSYAPAGGCFDLLCGLLQRPLHGHWQNCPRCSDHLSCQLSEAFCRSFAKLPGLLLILESPIEQARLPVSITPR